MSADDIDWKALFIRYVKHVSEVEGTHFLSNVENDDWVSSEAARAELIKIRDAEERSWEPIEAHMT